MRVVVLCMLTVVLFGCTTAEWQEYKIYLEDRGMKPEEIMETWLNAHINDFVDAMGRYPDSKKESIGGDSQTLYTWEERMQSPGYIGKYTYTAPSSYVLDFVTVYVDDASKLITRFNVSDSFAFMHIPSYRGTGEGELDD